MKYVLADFPLRRSAYAMLLFKIICTFIIWFSVDKSPLSSLSWLLLSPINPLDSANAKPDETFSFVLSWLTDRVFTYHKFKLYGTECLRLWLDFPYLSCFTNLKFFYVSAPVSPPPFRSISKRLCAQNWSLIRQDPALDSHIHNCHIWDID